MATVILAGHGRTHPNAQGIPAWRSRGGGGRARGGGGRGAARRAWVSGLGAEVGPSGVRPAASRGALIRAVLADALGMHLDASRRPRGAPASLSVVNYTPRRTS